MARYQDIHNSLPVYYPIISLGVYGYIVPYIIQDTGPMTRHENSGITR